MMDADEARALVDGSNAQDADDRTARLVELSEMTPSEGLVGFEGRVAELLFEDVKATWIYGCFTSTVLSAAAFCIQQLAGSIRFLRDDPHLPEETSSLEGVARLAVDRGIIDVSLQSQLVQLHDRVMYYGRAGLHEASRELDHHLLDAATFAEAEHPLLVDARLALVCAIAVVHRAP
jgi:hypothetical protein